uniref:NAD kinase n=1 Tax=uncultured delta proteobacterium HF0130_20J24 TaxID=710829 RepID=E0XXQ0_9DELT|nr:predicted sugar kinase [uncultured delta proteobacterium HF0130_20J24]
MGIFSPQYEQPVTELLHEWFVPMGIEISPLEENSSSNEELDLVLSFGGDGTVLAAISLFPQCPILAVNFGNVGFLTAGDREELTDMLQRVFEGEYIISERSVLECIHPNGNDFAVNEVVVRGATRLIAVELNINGQHIRRVRGDGVIVGTATGSTAYLLAAGSPVVIPELRCMIIAGLNEYDFRSRHLVVTAESRIRLKISEQTQEKEIYLSADGKEKIPLEIGDEVIICESSRQAKLVFMEKNYFFHNLSSRLSWFRSGE